MKKKSLLLQALWTLAIFSPLAPITGMAQGCDCQEQHQHPQNIEEHSIARISSTGTLIRIEDGSHWEVAYGYEKTALQWRSFDPIIITPNPYYFSSPTYAIRNLVTGTMVLANLTLGPVVNGNYLTRQVSGMDFAQGIVCLTDGSSWVISPKDIKSLSKWEVDDYIIIGVNNDQRYRNILINVSANRFVAAEIY